MHLLKNWKALAAAVLIASAGVAVAMQGTPNVGGSNGGPVSTSGTKRGPCRPLMIAMPIPPACATTCVIACTDPCATISYTPGKCLGTATTQCVEFTATVNKRVCRDCQCDFWNSTCINYGTYFSGSTTTKSCAAVSVTGSAG